MKKLILILAIALIATPALAALDVALVRNGANIDVVYTGAGTTAATRVRAFALDLQVASGPLTFTGFVGSSYKTGESTSASRGYGIYPAKISIGTDGVVGSWGTPDACSTDPGSGSGFSTNHIVLEFGSLYYGEVNAPATSGTLCSLTVNAASTSVITMTDELTYRGGVVLENGTQDLTAADKSFTYTTGSPPPSPATNGTPTVNVTTATGGLTTDLSWTAGAGATSYDVYFGTVLPGSPVNQAGTTFDTGTMVQGKTYYARVVSRNSGGTSAPLDWSFNTDCMKSTAAEYVNWTTNNVVKKANCWCWQYQKLGDVNGKEQGSGMTLKRIGDVDLGLFVTAFGKKRNALLTEALLGADINHLDQGSGMTLKAVGDVDLAILAANYGKKTINLSSAPYAGDYYFWTIAP